jgi:hypothetical protein
MTNGTPAIITERAREHGLITITSSNGRIEQPIHQCPHCSGYWIIEPGSRKVRRFCAQCNRLTCGGYIGGLRCLSHDPIEKRLDLVEAGKLPLSAL